MKKKNLNAKLQLTKKTIAKLNNDTLQDIQGGATIVPYCINIMTSPVVCRVIPVTTTTTTIRNSLGCPSLACHTDIPSIVENPINQIG